MVITKAGMILTWGSRDITGVRMVPTKVSKVFTKVSKVVTMVR
jgi:hypothetical protein